MNNRFQISIGDNNREVLIGDGNLSIRTRDITVGEGGNLTIVAGGAQYHLEPTEPPVEIAAEGEVLILIAQFDGYGAPRFKVEERIREALEGEFGSEGPVRVARLRNVAVQDGDYDKARRIGALCRASVVVWGWYDEVGFRPCFTIVDSRGLDGPVRDFAEVMTESANQEFRQYLFKGLPDEMAALATFVAGQLFYWSFRFDEALAAFERLNSRADPPQSVLTSSWFYKGVILGMRDGDVAGAAKSFEEAVKIDPAFVMAWYNLGDARYNLGDLEGAITAHSHALALEPEHLYALLERGDARSRIGRYAEAIEDYTRALNIRPWTRTYLARGRAFELGGQNQFAIADYESAQSLDPYGATATDRLKAYPFRGHGKSMSREGRHFDRRDFKHYYETALRILGRPNPPLGARAKKEDAEAAQLADAMSELLRATGFYLEAMPTTEDDELETAGEAVVAAVVSENPNIEALVDCLPPLVRLRPRWLDRGEGPFWDLVRLPAVRAKFGERFLEWAILLASKGVEYHDAFRILGKDILGSDEGAGLAVDNDVEELASRISVLREACKGADAKRSGRKYSDLTSASKQFVQWVLVPDADFLFDRIFSELLETDGEVRKAFNALAGNSAVERRLGERWTRILRLICAHGPNYPKSLRILGKTRIEQLPTNEISADPQAVELSNLMTAVQRAATADTRSPYFLDFLEELDDDSRTDLILMSYQDLRKLLHSSSECARRMSELLAFPPVAERIGRRILPVLEFLGRKPKVFPDALKALGRSLKLSTPVAELEADTEADDLARLIDDFKRATTSCRELHLQHQAGQFGFAYMHSIEWYPNEAIESYRAVHASDDRALRDALTRILDFPPIAARWGNCFRKIADLVSAQNSAYPEALEILGRELTMATPEEAIVVDPEAASLAENLHALRISMKGLDYTLSETCEAVITQLMGSTKRDEFASKVSTLLKARPEIEVTLKQIFSLPTVADRKLTE